MMSSTVSNFAHAALPNAVGIVYLCESQSPGCCRRRDTISETNCNQRVVSKLFLKELELT